MFKTEKKDILDEIAPLKITKSCNTINSFVRNAIGWEIMRRIFDVLCKEKCLYKAHCILRFSQLIFMYHSWCGTNRNMVQCIRVRCNLYNDASILYGSFLSVFRERTLPAKISFDGG